MLVPEKSARMSILQKLREIMSEVRVNGSPEEGSSPWPFFKEVRRFVATPVPVLIRFQVFTTHDGVYQYRFINISMRTGLFFIYDDHGVQQATDPNSDHPLLTLHSHIHPLHVIINAHQKIAAWKPRPADERTLEIINDINEIWSVWNSVPPTNEFITHGKWDDTDYSSLGPPSETRSSSRHSGSSLGKRSLQDGDSDDGGGVGRQPGSSRFRKHQFGGRYPQSADELCPSRKSSVNSLDLRCATCIQTWQDGLLSGHTPSLSVDIGADAEGTEGKHTALGSPKVTGCGTWEPLWDRRWVDTSSFTSNDWAYYHNTCNLVGDFQPADFGFR